ncbi:uncharacterized protein LOC142634317 isoform X4 [Castanea sativa]|uniref:uncharacterized protein LOC142634317 isoform X4 n=1 Tax=Castanea sativa TaxID=21020 RepID=UPI003F64DDD7
MAGTTTTTTTLFLSLFSHSQTQCKTPQHPCFKSNIEKRVHILCSAKKKLSFTDQILDYIEGGPKLRKWYGAPDPFSKDESTVEDDDQSEVEEVRDAVLVSDGDSEIGQEGFLSNVEGLKGVQHVVLLSQLSAYRGSGGIQALMKSNARKLAEQDESLLMASGIPYTIIRAGLLQSTPGGQQGFSFEEGSAARRNLSKEDAAFICVQALDAVPQRGFIFEVVNGDEKISDWQECMARLMEKAGQQLQ